MSAQRIYPLSRLDPGSWALIPRVVDRVAMFCRKHDTDTPAEVICQRVVEHFVVDEATRQTVRVWVGVQGDELIGHCLVTLDEWCGTIIGTIVQYESDLPLERALVVAAFGEIAEWAKSKGARTLRLLTLHKDDRGHARARLFQRLYGFHATHVVCDRDRKSTRLNSSH
mgnify:CR=1 FL=1